MVDEWSGGQITINAKPSFAWVAPAAGAYIEAGTGDYTLEWTLSDPEDDAQLQLRFSNTYSATCAGYTSLGAAISESSATTSYAFTSTRDSNVYYFCATVTDGYNTVVVNSGNVNTLSIYRRCLWTGTTDTTWSTASNWTSCNSVAPAITDRPIIPSAPANQPTVTANTTVAAFGIGTGGGKVTVQAGAQLALTYSPETIGSSVSFAGDSASCTTCLVQPKDDYTIFNDATLSLDTGIQVATSGSGVLYVGNGVTSGHLVTSHSSSVASEWPSLSFGNLGHGIKVQGAAGDLSSVAVDGLHIHKYHHVYGRIAFLDYYEIAKFDKVSMDINGVNASYDNITLSNCDHATITDTNWSDLIFVDTGLTNIDVSNCSDLGGSTITITGSGAGFGEGLEADPNNLLSWTNGISFTCTWTGANGTAWDDPANWDSCVNSRGGYPDQNDWIVIPNTTNKPIITGTFFTQGFGSGSDSTITISSGSSLKLLKDLSMNGNITLQGATPNCTDCILDGFKPGDSVRVPAGSTLTLLRGIKLVSQYMYYIYGTFKALGGANPDEWPVITSSRGMQVLGTAGNPATLEISGLKSTGLSNKHSTVHFGFLDYFRISALEGLEMGSAGSTDGTFLKISACTDSVVDSKNWTGLRMVTALQATGSSVSAAASCSGLGPINLYPALDGGGDGFDELAEDDPAGYINWH